MNEFKEIIVKIIKKIKRYIFTKNVKKSCGSYDGIIRVNNKTKVTKKTFLGENVNFNGMEILGEGKVVIGDNFHSGKECMIITHIHNYDKGKKIPYDETYIYKEVIIEENVWIGSRVNILGGVRIGEGAIIQAGSTVVKDIPKFAIAGGHPAKVFKYRDIEHYKLLKEERKFH